MWFNTEPLNTAPTSNIASPVQCGLLASPPTPFCVRIGRCLEQDGGRYNGGRDGGLRVVPRPLTLASYPCSNWRSGAYDVVSRNVVCWALCCTLTLVAS